VIFAILDGDANLVLAQAIRRDTAAEIESPHRPMSRE